MTDAPLITLPPVPRFRLEPLEPQASPPPRTGVTARRSVRQKQLLMVALAVVAAVSDGTMSFLDHLEELRKRLMISIAALFVGVLAAYAFVDTIFDFMMRPLQATLPVDGGFMYTEPAEFFLVKIKMAIVAGIFLSSPLLLWQLWLFVAPGLYAREKRYAIPFVVFSTLFFVAGGLFSHFVAFRTLWAFFASLETDLVTFTPRIATDVLAVHAHALGVRGHFSDSNARVFPGSDGHDHTAPADPQLQVRRAHHLHPGSRADGISRSGQSAHHGRPDVGALWTEYSDCLGLWHSQQGPGLSSLGGERPPQTTAADCWATMPLSRGTTVGLCSVTAAVSLRAFTNNAS